MARITRAKARLDLVAAATARNNGVAAHKLPYELVLYTLQLALASLERHHQRVRFLRSITAVSSCWRTFALSMPELWTEIVYSKRFDSEDEKDFNVIFHRIKTYLERSRKSPISVNLITHGTTPKDGRKLLNFIIPHLQRCHTLSLELSDTLAERYLPLPGPLPLLRKADIGAWLLDRWETRDRTIILVFDETNASPLRELDLISNMPFRLMDIRARELKRVRLGGGNDWKDIAGFLAQCSQLEDLTLYYNISNDDEVVHGGPITLSQLKLLTLSGRPSLAFGAMLKGPILERLILASESPADSIFDFIPLPSPAPPIHTVSIRAFIFPLPLGAFTLSFFRFCGDITTLELESCGNVDIVVTMLHNGASPSSNPGKAMLPQLKSLRIYMSSFELEVILASVFVLLEERPSLCLALKCENLPYAGWEEDFWELGRYGERVSRWYMQPWEPY